MRVGDGLYARSAYGPESAWYRHATRNTARIQAGGVEADVTLRPIDDMTINAQVGAAFEAKYHSQPSSVRLMVTPTAAETTVRLDTAD